VPSQLRVSLNTLFSWHSIGIHGVIVLRPLLLLVAAYIAVINEGFQNNNLTPSEVMQSIIYIFYNNNRYTYTYDEMYCCSLVINSPAIAALVKVLTAPVNIALIATRETSPARDGAI
jgi:hypothetical protein